MKPITVKEACACLNDFQRYLQNHYNGISRHSSELAVVRSLIRAQDRRIRELERDKATLGTALINAMDSLESTVEAEREHAHRELGKIYTNIIAAKPQKGTT